MKIFENNNQIIEYFGSSNLLKVSFLENTCDLSNVTYIREIGKLIEKIEEYKPYKLIMDARDFRFVIAPYIQVWHDRNFVKRVSKAGLHQIAIINSTHKLSNLSLQQTMAGKRVLKSIIVNFFKEEEDAIAWLKETEAVFIKQDTEEETEMTKLNLLCMIDKDKQNFIRKQWKAG